MIALAVEVEPTTKDYLIYRVAADGANAEVAGESILETEARRFAGIMATAETVERIYYEVRSAAGDELVFSTGKESPRPNRRRT